MAIAPVPSRPPRAFRSADDRMLAGVAAGLAAHLGLPVLWVRVFFIAACAFGGLGVALYGALWLFMPMESADLAAAPGLEAAARQGRRPSARSALRDVGVLVALGAVALGVLGIGHHLWERSLVFWPVAVAVAGVGVLWWQADEAQRERWLDTTGRISLLRALVGSGKPSAYLRLLVGLGLIVVAIAIFGVQSGNLSSVRDVVVAGVIGIVGIGLTLGPWLLRMTGELSDERAARVRQQERADVAAHLHDSVLQTLALIQRHSEDPRAVSTLARAQERDLRAWLYADQPTPGGTVASALRAAAAEVEDAHGVPVEVVVVGDAPLGEHASALVGAAREAMVNAAKHSGAPKVDVYAELSGRPVEVYVRDRGVGFAVGDLPDGRMGVRNSIVGRMERHGGVAEIRSNEGDGTEVRLSIELDRAQ